VLLNDFIKLAPPIFTGMDSSDDPQRFLNDIWRRCEALGCTDHRVVSSGCFSECGCDCGCGCDCFLEYFSLRNALEQCFFILKKLFLTSAYQNDLKTPKNINLKLKKEIKKINFF